jgi:hypothetical protein
MSGWVGMAVPFVVGLAGGAGIAYALSSGSGKSSTPAAPASASFEEKQAIGDQMNNEPALNPFLKGGKRRRTRRGGKKRGHKKTSRR